MRHVSSGSGSLTLARKLLAATEWQQVVPEGEFPELLDLQPTKGYVRQVLAEQVMLTAQDEKLVEIDEVPSDFCFFTWTGAVNGRTQDASSHQVIRQLIKKEGEGYRLEDSENLAYAKSEPRVMV